MMLADIAAALSAPFVGDGTIEIRGIADPQNSTGSSPKPDANALKVRAPDGNIFEIIEKGGFEQYKKKAAAAQAH
ncbi:MAG TPA: hypothetical protein VIY51_17480 [Xanthobacteraceae bacterium]